MKVFSRNKKAIQATVLSRTLTSRIFFFVSFVCYYVIGQDAVGTSSNVRKKSCILEALEKRLSHPRNLLFDDIDMAVGFNILPRSQEVEFMFIVPTHGWVGFGISEVGSMKGADIAVIEPQENGSFLLTDRYSKNFVEPVVDKIQNWELLNAQHETILINDCESEPNLMSTYEKDEAGNFEVPITTVVVRRMLDTCDAEDEPLSSKFLKNYFIAAYGENHHKKLQYHTKRASIVEYVFTPEPLVPKEPKGKAIHDIISPLMEIPQGMSNYCYSRVIIEQPLAVTSFSAINTTNIHHMILFKDEERTFEGDYVCGVAEMGTLKLAWAVGGGKVIYPGDLYQKVEPGEYILESHFENLAGNKFHAAPGFRLYTNDDESQFNEKNEIEIIRLDGRFNTPIPAGLSRAEKRFEIPSECFNDIPANGVTVLATAAHMHNHGGGMQIYRTRGDQNDLVFEQREFDFNKQNPIWKPWTILPGDRIYWKCTWDTTTSKRPIPWGTFAEDEMCLAFLLTNKGLPFQYIYSDLSLNGKTYGSCSTKRLGLENNYEQNVMGLTEPENDFILVEMNNTIPQEQFIEKGRERNICQALVRAEVVPPTNNWLLGSPIYYFVISWIIQIVGRRAISWWCSRYFIRRSELWITEKSLMFMEMVVCSTVLIMVLSEVNSLIRFETNEVYDVASETPLGDRYINVIIATDFLSSSYVITIVCKAVLQLDYTYDAIHHGVALMSMWLLVNATEFVYAPSFIFFFGAIMLLHASSTAPVFFSFLMLKLNPNPARCNKLLAILFMALAVVKQLAMISIHIASIFNYLLFFQDETFRLKEISGAKWNNRPYSELRMTNRDLWMNLPWIEMLKIVLPILWCILACVQLYMTRRQLQIGIYEYNKTFTDTDKIDECKGKRTDSSECIIDRDSLEETSKTQLLDDLYDRKFEEIFNETMEYLRDKRCITENLSSTKGV